MEIIKLKESNNLFFDKICDQYYNWLGIKNNESIEEVKTFKDDSPVERLYKLEI